MARRVDTDCLQYTHYIYKFLESNSHNIIQLVLTMLLYYIHVDPLFSLVNDSVGS